MAPYLLGWEDAGRCGWTTMLSLICPVCKRPFPVHPYKINIGRTLTCSRSCSARFMWATEGYYEKKFGSVEERFWRNVDKSGGEDTCWPWTAYRLGVRHDGYGNISVRGSIIKAHRLAFMLTYGPIGNLNVLHKCDNPPCCNPTHLNLGTRAENNHDRDAKGRGARLIGESNGFSKLTESDVRKIKSRYSTGFSSYNVLAREFGVSKHQIAHIVKGRQWKHVS
jgi:hypothetical protein